MTIPELGILLAAVCLAFSAGWACAWKAAYQAGRQQGNADLVPALYELGADVPYEDEEES